MLKFRFDGRITTVLLSAFSTVTVSTLSDTLTFSRSTAAKNSFSSSLSKS